MLPWIAALAQALSDGGVDPIALVVAWGRVLPVVLIVPAFAMPGLPGGLRWGIALILALSLCPVVVSGTAMGGHVAGAGGMVSRMVEALATGTAVAFSAAAPLWAATMAGSLFDLVRRQRASTSPPFTTLLTLLSTAIFFATGAPARIAAAVTAPAPAGILDAAALHIVHGIDVAIAIGAPILLASLAIDLVSAVVTRAADATWGDAAALSLRTLGIVLLGAALMERVTYALMREIR